MVLFNLSFTSPNTLFACAQYDFFIIYPLYNQKETGKEKP